MTQNGLAQGLHWVMEKKWRSGVLLGVSLLFFYLGLDMVFFMPGRQKVAALVKTQAALESAKDLIASAEGRLKREGGWYKVGAGYIDGLSVQNRKAVTTLFDPDGVDDLLLKAKAASPRAALRLLKDANVKIEEAERLGQATLKTLDKNAAFRAKVRADFAVTLENVVYFSKSVATSRSRFDEEKNLYLSRYTDELAKILSEVEPWAPKTQAEVSRMSLAMPADADTSGKGDPTIVAQESDHVRVVMAAVADRLAFVHKRLDYLDEAQQQAEATYKRSQTEHLQALAEISTVKARTKYFLKEAFATLQVAEEARDEAKAALLTRVEGPLVDMPAAYEAAKDSVSRSHRAKAEAVSEVQRAQKAKDMIALAWRKLNAGPEYLRVTQIADSTLRRHHNHVSWKDVSGYESQVAKQVALARQAVTAAEQHVDLSVQDFRQGLLLADSAVVAVDAAASLSQALVAKSAQLEKARADFASALQRGTNEVSAQAGNINSYGEYDSSAKSAYDRAHGLLSDAQRAAADKRYDAAVSFAQQAESSARGSGQRAYDAYVAHKRRVEAAAAEAAARLARSASDDSSSSGASSSSSSSSNSGSSGSSYRGGSDSSYKGGSDSDF